MKPEFTIDVTPPANAVGGDTARFTVDARYLFGRPAAGMRLHYRGYYAQSYFWWRRDDVFGGGFVPYDALPSARIEGDATADKAGRATFAVRTPSVSRERTLMVEVEGRDDAGKTVSVQARTQVTPASLFLTVTSDAYFAAAGEETTMTVRSRTYAKNGFRAGVPVTVTFTPLYYASGSPYRDDH